MIKKIQTNEYIKRVDNMSESERADYLKRVGEWLETNGTHMAELGEQSEAILQNVQTVSVSWNDADCKAWEEGVCLLSAMAATSDTWLPDMLYTKSAKRCIKRMMSLLTEVQSGANTDPQGDGKQQPQTDGNNPQIGNKKPQTADKTKQEAKVDAGVGVPVRPKHIDQYVYLLPQKTQERAAQLRELLRDLDVSREKLRLLTETPKSSATDRESWAKKVKKLDDTVRSIYKELDDEWTKLVKTGMVTVDVFGNAHINAAAQAKVQALAEAKAEAEAERQADPQIQVAALRRWLIDTRKLDNDVHTEKWVSKYREMVALGGMETVTDKVKDSAKHYGINLDVLTENNKTNK